MLLLLFHNYFPYHPISLFPVLGVETNKNEAAQEEETASISGVECPVLWPFHETMAHSSTVCPHPGWRPCCAIVHVCVTFVGQ